MASWIALEDIQEGNGELMYYPGSQGYEMRCEAASRASMFRPRWATRAGSSLRER
jgi:hypothetical protein